MLRPILCDYIDAYTLVSGTMNIGGERAEDVA